MKRRIRLTESDLRHIVAEAVQTILTEGEQWIGSYDRDSFNRLEEKAIACQGRCSFNLCGVDFTMTPIHSGANRIRVTSGTDVVCEFYNIHGALVHAYSWANSLRQR